MIQNHHTQLYIYIYFINNTIHVYCSAYAYDCYGTHAGACVLYTAPLDRVDDVSTCTVAVMPDDMLLLWTSGMCCGGMIWPVIFKPARMDSIIIYL